MRLLSLIEQSNLSPAAKQLWLHDIVRYANQEELLIMDEAISNIAELEEFTDNMFKKIAAVSRRDTNALRELVAQEIKQSKV